MIFLIVKDVVYLGSCAINYLLDPVSILSLCCSARSQYVFQAVVKGGRFALLNKMVKYSEINKN